MLTIPRIMCCGGCVQLDDNRSLRAEVLPLIEQSKFFKHTSLDDLITKVRCLMVPPYSKRDETLVLK